MLFGASTWSCTGPCEKLLKRSWWNPLGVLTCSRTGPCEDLVEFLFKSSSRGPCSKILKILALVFDWKFFWDAHRKLLYEDLASSFTYFYIAGPAAAVAIMSNLICYCSMLLLLVSGTLTSYPPHCSRSLAGAFFMWIVHHICRIPLDFVRAFVP